MKILELRFKNLNSLYGEWVIDFTDPEYVAGGIFALTGPTGAGKSTVLDAVCLALYGATPRLGRITKSSNEIMSRQTGECYAEVLFASRAGRFRCHWEQWRARKKAEGALQGQEHQIIDADTGKPVETQKSLVGAVIEEKTGMDFDRFTRSILLAQGGFDTFLHAGIEEKSKILEQITGTGIYTLISQRVHERLRDEKDALARLRDQVLGESILSDDEKRETEREIAATLEKEKDLVSRISEIGKALSWLAGIDELNRDLRLLAEKRMRLQEKRKAFEPERVRFEQATRAALLDGVYALLSALRGQQADDQAALQKEQLRLPGLEKSARTEASSLQRAEQHKNTARAELETARPLIAQVRFLDQKIADRGRMITEETVSCHKKMEAISAEEKQRAEKQAMLAETEKRAKELVLFLEENAGDEWLVTGLTGVESQFEHLFSRQNEIVQKKTSVRNLELSWKKAAEVADKRAGFVQRCKQELEVVEKKFQKGKRKLEELLAGKLLREYRAEKEGLQKEKSYLARIASLEEHRSHLENGKPCPLCGAIDHPFARGNVPEPDALDPQIAELEKLIASAEQQEERLENLQTAVHRRQLELGEAEKQEAQAVNERNSVRRNLDELQAGLKKSQTDFEELKENIARKLTVQGVKINFSDPQSTLSSLKLKMETWQNKVREKEELEKRIGSLESERKSLAAVIANRRQALKEEQDNLEELEKKYASETAERKKLYGDKDPVVEEQRLHTALGCAEEAEKQVREKNTKIQQALLEAKTNFRAVENRIKQRASDLEKAEADFLTELGSVAFTDEKQFLDARLTREERDLLQTQAKELETAQSELDVRQKDHEARLAAELEKKVTDKNVEELEAQRKEFEKLLENLRDTIAACRHRLTEDAAARERQKERQAALEVRKKEYERFYSLHELIGSADGKKFRNFAQGLTFELMIAHANQELEKMTDRYLLVRDSSSPLELNVIDSYQAGEIRSIKNLSGGESFIVSLVLALGLSRMSSRKVRVDSLFLDEGFGSLDEDALETALDTLAGLQQDGKLIGVISHVPALKDRIRTQINVSPLSGGRSEMTGPGCRKILG